MIPLSDERAGTRPPVVTVAIIVACVAVYVFVQPTFGRDTGSDAEFEYRHAAIPYELTHGRPLTNCAVSRAASQVDAPRVCSLPEGQAPFARQIPICKCRR